MLLVKLTLQFLCGALASLLQCCSRFRVLGFVGFRLDSIPYFRFATHAVLRQYSNGGLRWRPHVPRGQPASPSSPILCSLLATIYAVACTVHRAPPWVCEYSTCTVHSACTVNCAQCVCEYSTSTITYRRGTVRHALRTVYGTAWKQ